MSGNVIPKDFAAAVKDIKLAILQARAKAAHLANAEALKLYFFVGGYVSKKTRNAKWGSGAIDALSNQLQVELPGLRGFSATNIKNMRAFFEFWADDFSIRNLPNNEICSLSTNKIRQMPSAELGIEPLSAFLSVGFSQHREIVRAIQSKDEAWYYICASARALWSYEQLLQHLHSDDYHHIGALPNNFGKTLSPMTLASKAVRSFRDEYLLELVNLDNVDAHADQDVDERVLSKALVSDVEKTIQALGATTKHPDENPSIGLLLCEKMNKGFVEFAVRDKSKPLGIATYKTLKSIPKPYQTLAPVIEGVRRVLSESMAKKTPRKRTVRKGGGA